MWLSANPKVYPPATASLQLVVIRVSRGMLNSYTHAIVLS